MSRVYAPRDLVFVHQWDKDGRPAVVMQTRPGLWMVCCGTGSEEAQFRHEDEICVLASSQEGQELGLSKDIYFRPSGFVWAKREAIQGFKVSACPVSLFRRLSGLFHKHRSTSLGTIPPG
jgi:hypothetical protein